MYFKLSNTSHLRVVLFCAVIARHSSYDLDFLKFVETGNLGSCFLLILFLCRLRLWALLSNFFQQGGP